MMSLPYYRVMEYGTLCYYLVLYGHVEMGVIWELECVVVDCNPMDDEPFTPECETGSQ